MTGEILGGSMLTFANNGVTPDITAGDNIFSAVLNVPTTGNNVSVSVVVSATGKQSSTNTATFPMVQPPANDLFANRAVVTGSSAIANGSNVGASKEAAEPIHGGNAGGKSVWWTWTAPASGRVNLTAIGSGFDTLLAVYSGTSVSALSLVANNNNQGPGYFSAVNFAAAAGTSYEIAVDGFNGASGLIRLNLSLSEINRLRLLAPQPLPEGGFRIWVSSADGSPIDPVRARHVEIHTLTDITEELGALTRLAGTLAPTDGLMRLDDLGAADQPVRLYRLVER